MTRLTKGVRTTETRYQLEAKVIAPNGISLSVMSERVRPHTTENGKRDCEIKAFRRLARRLKEAFPRLPICIVGDALYACAPVMRICRDNGWKFILTFKEGRSPDAYEMACDSMLVSKGRCGTLVVRGENQRKVETGVVAWTAGVRFTTQSEGEEFNVVACEETRGGTYRGMFATNYDVDCAEVASEVVAWGRRSRNFYLLMQLANNLWQVFNACVIPKVAEGCRKMAQSEWVELLRRAFHEIGITAEFATMPRRYVRRMDL